MKSDFTLTRGYLNQNTKNPTLQETFCKYLLYNTSAVLNLT